METAWKLRAGDCQAGQSEGVNFLEYVRVECRRVFMYSGVHPDLTWFLPVSVTHPNCDKPPGIQNLPR